MLTAPATKRRGVTLVEVLTAIFIMAIGLMALLTLFPLGAITMAQAIKDDRAGTVARNAESQMRAYWQYAVNKDKKLPDATLLIEMRDPYRLPGDPILNRTANAGPSYPVFVDGVGWLRYGNSSPKVWQEWLAGTTGTIKRQVPSLLITNDFFKLYPPPLPVAAQYQETMVLNFFTSSDDTTFTADGVPPSSSIERQRRYSFAYMLRLPNCTRAQEIELTVVVYANRSVGVTQDLLPQGEAAFTATFNSGETTATLAWGSTVDPPALRRGSWLLDATMPTPANNTLPIRGHFYRVVNVAEPIRDPMGNFTQSVELETAILPGAAGAASTATVLENVIEVFDKGLVAEGN